MRVLVLMKGRVLPGLLFILYIFFLLYLTVFKRLFFGTTIGMFFESYRLNTSSLDYNLNLVPFRTIYGYLAHPPSKTVALTNLLGNVLAFMPLGFLVPLVFKKIYTIRWILIVSIGSSFVIELIQLILGVGSLDVDDVLLNLLGGLLGFFVYKGFKEFFKKYNRKAELAKESS